MRTPTNRPRLILASASPRRRELLERLGVEFECVAPGVAEVRQGDPELVVLENARRKARAGAQIAAAPAGAYVLGVDTDVALDGRLLGKPDGEAAARQSLELLSGRKHDVLSGVVVLGPAIGSEVPVERSGIGRTEVHFARLDQPVIDLYLASGEWRDRAGGYAIQGLGSILVDAIEGDFSNVVGLPLVTLLELVPALIDPPAPSR